MGITKTFESMLEKGNENAIVRYTLGTTYYSQENYKQAIEHFKQAVKLDPNYSSAWKMFGRALADVGQIEDAINAYKSGIKVAESNAEKQVVKEISDYLKDLENGSK